MVIFNKRIMKFKMIQSETHNLHTLFNTTDTINKIFWCLPNIIIHVCGCKKVIKIVLLYSGFFSNNLLLEYLVLWFSIKQRHAAKRYHHHNSCGILCTGDFVIFSVLHKVSRGFFSFQNVKNIYFQNISKLKFSSTDW